MHATYERTLEFLRRSKELQPDIPTKSSLMVGLGETIEEIYETMDDLRANDGHFNNWSIFTTIT